MNRQLKCTPIEQDNANSNLRQVVSRNTHKWCFNWLLPMVSTFGACSLKSSASIWRGVVFVVLVVGLMVTMFQNVFAYDTEWKWANRDETFQWSVVHSAAIAPNGDSIYVTTLNTGIHIAKYNTADGNKLWDKIVSETNTVKGIAVDNDENIYITGSISSSTSFDGKLVILKGWNDVFIAKYNSNGVLQWVKTAGGAGRDSGESIAVDSFGNPYIVGYVSQGGCFENNCPTELDDQSLFVAKYSTNGDLIWVQQVVEGRVEESSADIVVDASNNVYITVGVYEKDGKPFPNIVGKIVYIAKYDSDGQKKWDDGIYSPNGDESVGGIAVNQDAVYVTGYFTQKVCLVSNGSCYDGDSSGYFDVFLAKYKPNGTSANLENFEVFGSAFTNLQVHDVAINSLGEPIIVGDFTGTLIGINTVSSEGKDDIFVATLIDNEWTLQRVGGKNSDSGQVVTINHTTGDIYVAGQLGDGDFTFPPLSFTDSSPQAVPSMFVGKISLIPSITGTVLNDDTDPKIGLHKWTVKLKSVDNENNIFSTETEEGVYTFKDSYPLETYLLYIVPPEEGWEHRFPENGLGIYTINLEESVVFEDQDFRYGSSAVINIPDNEYLCINGKSNGIGYSWRLENSSIYQNPDAEGIASGDSIDLAKDFVFKEFPDQGIFVNGYENNCFAIDGTLCVASKGTVITPNCEEAEINGDACIVGKAGCTYNPTIRLIKSSLDTTLSVSQTSHDVDGTSNTITIDVAKIGSGSIMGWVAEADDSWLTIESGEYGENNGTITVRYDANSTEERTGTITVVAPGAENGSQTVTVKQASPSLVTVNGTIWIDTNTTGIKDDGDSKADAYWYTEYVHLTNLDSQQVFSAMMFVDYIDDYDYFGNWMTIDKIPAGDYKIEVQLPTNWVQLTPASDDIVHIDDSTGAINIGMQPPITVGFGIDGEISINDVEPNSLCKRPSSYFRLQPSGKESVMSYSISSQIIDGLTFQTLGFAGTVQVQNNIPSVTISPNNPNNEVQNILLNGNTISFDIPMTFNESADSVDTGNIPINFVVTNETGYSTNIITCGYVPDTPLQELYAGSDMEVKVGETVDFQGIVYDPDTNDHYEVSWYFEDTGEEVKDTLTPTHVYTTPGTYEVSLFAGIDTGDKHYFGEDILIVTVGDYTVPNYGDGNGDGTLDSQQVNVTSIKNAVDGNYLTLQAMPADCALTNVKVKTEALLGNDSSYDYPYGLVEFKAACETANITVFYHGSEELNGAYRKYGPTPPYTNGLSEWYSLPNVAFGFVKVGDKYLMKVSFTLKDGELGDDTGVDGIIYDIGGFANPPSVTYYSVNSQMLDTQGNPIAGVTIQIGNKSVVTDADGNWEITGLAEGNYTATISKSGYTFESTDFNVADSNVELEVIIGQPDVVYAIQGTIQDDLNNPIS
ncbi:MAG: carboxypeptidase regulatory-like domain-containing protein, partial [Candidatus Marithrix sp.]|nr:carboxypeptidase regulatory-like domain-containing protein [Candidatus Marithrix sp.]